MFRTKICGITTAADAHVAVVAGADAIGLNFFAGSPRCVTPEDARSISAEIGESALSVGVFVNAPADQINSLVDQVGLDCAQLHGDEPPATLSEISPRTKVIRVYRLTDQGLSPVVRDLAACEEAGRSPDAILIDAAAAGAYGGTGQIAPWQHLSDYRSRLGDIGLILAGGLTPSNVGAAIDAVGPDGVDVASGVERSPGVKAEELVRQFLTCAEAAFAKP